MRETLREIMRGVEIKEGTKPKRVANNTVEYVRPDGSTVIRLHHTDIVQKHPDGTFTLNSGGWRTSTTKDRINSYSPARLFQAKGEWFLSVRERDSFTHPNFTNYVFTDGMTVDKDGQPLSYKPDKVAKETARRKKLAREINQFCKLVDKVDEEHMIPSAGDCWLCMVDTATIKGGGNGWNSNNADTAPGGDTEHLLSHIKEGYVHGTLLANALQWAGYKDPMFILQYDVQNKDRGNTKRALRRYLRRRLGLG